MKKLTLPLLFIFILFSHSPYAQSTSDCEIVDIQPLTEINNDSLADAYPWLSPDGLRLYFVRQILSDGSYNRILMSSRASLNEPFGPADTVRFGLAIDTLSLISPRLSKDELEIYFVGTEANIARQSRRELYYARRESINDDFSNVQLVQLMGIDGSFITTPSFTSDRSQLFIFNSLRSNGIFRRNIFQLEQLDAFTYQLVDSLPMVAAKEFGGCWLSDDGLSLYTDRRDTSLFDGNSEMFVYTRANWQEPFANPLLLESPLALNFGNYQIAISEETSLVAFVSNRVASWSGNQLYTGRKINRTTRVDELDHSDWTLYPNPANALVRIQLARAWVDRVVVRDMLGRIADVVPWSGQEEVIDVSDWAKGMYVVELWRAERMMGRRKLIIAR